MPIHNPPHPGDVLREWLASISVTEAAKSLDVTRVALSRVLNGAAGVSADMDLRLSKALGTTPGTWYTMQTNYDMWQAKRYFRAKVKRIIASPVEPEPKLLEQQHGERLDTRTSQTAVGGDTALEALGEVHGAESTGRQGTSRSQRL